MKKVPMIVLWVCLAQVLIYGLPLAIGIWLPDVFISHTNTLAEQRLASGHSFRVIQYWNHGDFYNTELVHTYPDGQSKTNLLDPDDAKTWSVPLLINEQGRQGTVTLGGRRKRDFSW